MGGDGADIATVSGAVVSLVSAMTYIITEGKIDATYAATAIESVQTITDTVTDDGD